MSKIIYVPLEHIDGRYTKHLDRDIVGYLTQNNIPYVRIYPEAAGSSSLPAGCFLNAAYTSKFKSMQMAMIAGMYERREVQDGDQFFFSDIWFPGIESIAYMNYFHKVDAKITGVIHAGSFTDTDFVRDLERWAKNFEDMVFDISTKIYCASNFIRNDIIKKRMVDARKLVVTGLPVDYSGLDKHKIDVSQKQDMVVFNGRLCDEKQPWLFDELEKHVRQRLPEKNIKFVKTQEANLSKDQYYDVLAQSKVVVSYALQENFGFGIAEAAYLGCTPVLPNRLVYPELYSGRYLFDSFDESVDLVVQTLSSYQPETIKIKTSCFDCWFKGLEPVEWTNGSRKI
jgi:glycosyltransferase involved in cell wall biosynthesis